MAFIGLLFISAFVTIHDHFMKPRTGSSVLDFFQNTSEVKDYLYRGTKAERPERIHRADAIVLAWKDLSKDSLTLAFGLGMGNVMGSYFESSLGKHTDKMQYGAQMLAVTHLFWELGLLGVIVYVTFFVFFFKDALLLKKSDDIFGSFALGWSAVVVIIGLSLVYKNMIVYNLINFMFWYFSGIVAAKTFRMRALSEKYAT